MKWLITLLTSSIGKKLVMAATGLFLCSFLVIHLLGNLSLLNDDGGAAFNDYAYFMTHFLPIKLVSFGLYGSILLHAVLGILMYFKNRKARGVGYKVKSSKDTTWASRNMALLGTLLLAFIFIHMGDFFAKMKMGELSMVMSEGLGHEVSDLYTRVKIAFDSPMIVAIYIIGQIVLAAHLWHGFGSGFVTLGLNNKKYTPIVNFIGRAYAVIIPLGFILIPVIHFMSK